MRPRSTLAKDVATLQSDIAVLRGRAEQASKDVSQGRSDTAATRDALKDLVGRLSGEADRLARLEASRDKVTADTSEIRQRLSAVERDLKRLADQATAPRAPAPEPPSGDERPEAPPPSGDRL